MTTKPLPLAALALVAAASVASSAPPPLAELQADAVRSAVGRLRTAVVQLQAIGGGDPLGGGDSKPTTGVLLAGEGLVLTSSYGLDPPPSAILITDDSGHRTTGRLLAIDHNRQVAFIAPSSVPSEPAPLLPAAEPIVGETAIAIGRAYRSDEPNVAVGIVSALDRLYGRAVQTDAAVSPASYGGLLVNLRGEVIGLITPLGPAAAGWGDGVGLYDSGIGFAVPLPAIVKRLERLQRGEDIHRGLAGVAFGRGSHYSSKPELMTVHPGGPADQAGLKAGDVIMQANGRRVECPNDFRLAADALDDGQRLTLVASRGEETITAELTLAAELQPYRHPYLGVLAEINPQEDSEGMLIRHVFDNSPAKVAGVLAGDRLTAINQKPAATRSDALAAMGGVLPGEPLAVEIRRGKKTIGLEATAAKLTFDARAPLTESVAEQQEELFVPGSTRKCVLTRPRGVASKAPVLVWLGGDWPVGLDAETLVAAGCVVAEPAEGEESPSPEAERAYLSDLLDLVTARDDIDADRLAIGAGGRRAAVALSLTFAEQSRLVGVVIDRWPGRPPRIPSSSPQLRVGVLQTSGGRLDAALAEHLSAQGFPSLTVEGDSLGAKAAAWLHGLSRF